MFRAALQLLGLLQGRQTEWRAWRPSGVAIDEELVGQLVAARTAARAARQFAEADRLRAEIDALGVVLKDGPEGTTWELRR